MQLLKKSLCLFLFLSLCFPAVNNIGLVHRLWATNEGVNQTNMKCSNQKLLQFCTGLIANQTKAHFCTHLCHSDTGHTITAIDEGHGLILHRNYLNDLSTNLLSANEVDWTLRNEKQHEQKGHIQGCTYNA